MRILVTNDDGITSPGLLTLVKYLKSVGTVSVLAPDRNWSASGHVKTLNRPLRVNAETLADGTPALSCDGAPSDCVALAALGLIKEKIDLVVSGINPYPNLGNDMTYSGTVTAAMEGAIWGIPSIAMSLDGSGNINHLDFSGAAATACRISKQVYEHGLPVKTLLNVNVPNLPIDQIQGFQVTRLGLRVYQDELVRREDPQGRPYYWIGGKPPTGIAEDSTDFGALAAGYVSITPIHMDMTAHHLREAVSTWVW
ncbi:MAG: 5'/3'-nucleotidase SurE [Anaerolineae bacterium]|nr:5'/3'-nucleotidase SurE [Anaerolineae bacterium]